MPENMPEIKYPYLPEGRVIYYVDQTHCYMVLARDIARRRSLDKVMPTTTLIVKGSLVMGVGANGSDYHEKHKCQRVALGCKTGEGYEFCEGCHPKNHSERKAIENAGDLNHSTEGADLYLWGHWWCCKPCWNAIIEAGIARVFLVKGSEIMFNKEHPDNIVGRQFQS